MNSYTNKFIVGTYFFFNFSDESDRYHIGFITKIEKWRTALGLQRIYHYDYIYKSEGFKKSFDWIKETDSFVHGSPMYKISIVSEELDNLKQIAFAELL